MVNNFPPTDLSEEKFCSQIENGSVSANENEWLNFIYAINFHDRNQFLSLISSCPKTLWGTDLFILILGMYDTFKHYSTNDEIIRSSVRKKSLEELDDEVIRVLNL